MLRFAFFASIFILLHHKFVMAMKLVLLTQPFFFVEEDKILSALFEEGLDCLHLFKSCSSPIYIERLLSLLNSDYYKKIRVHDHFYLKNEYRLGGIHLDDADAPKPVGYRGKLSRTCYNIENLKFAKKNADYVFLRYKTKDSLDAELQSNLTIDKLEIACQSALVDRHVYVQGDVKIENFARIKEMGFGGVVVCKDLWKRFNIHDGLNYKELIEHFIKIRKAVG